MKNGNATTTNTLPTILSSLRLFSHIVIGVFLATIFESCCRKVECEEWVEEEISFRMSDDLTNGFAASELNNIVGIVYDPTTNEKLDSAPIRRQNFYSAERIKNPENVYSYNALHFIKQNSLKGMNIILKDVSGTYTDTLFNIMYIEGIHNYTCSPCLADPGKESKPFITNRSLTYKGKKYEERDFPVIITKK